MLLAILRFALVFQVPGAASDTPAKIHEKALASFRQGQYSKAAELFEQEINAAPESTGSRDTVVLIAQSFFAAGKLKEALPWLEKAAKAGLNTVEVNYMLGNIYVQTRQAEKAVAAFAAMFGLPPDSASAHLLTAQLMMKQEFEEDAQKEAVAALKKNVALPQAHYVLGELATFRGDLELAVQELAQEIAINPGFAMAYYKLGDAYTRREDWAAAIPNLQRAIWLNPEYSGPFILLGKAYWKRGELANAEGALRRALVLDPRNSSARYMLGRTLTEMGRTDEAKQMLEESKAMKH